MEGLEYAALLGAPFLSTIRPFEVGRKEGCGTRPESLLRIRYPAKKLEDQATQTRKGGHRCYDIQHQVRNTKAENYRAAAHFYLTVETRLKAKIKEVRESFEKTVCSLNPLAFLERHTWEALRLPYRKGFDEKKHPH